MFGVDVILTDNFSKNGEYKKHYLDLYSDEAIKLTYSLKDIKDISKRNSTYSRSIKIPGTASNNTTLTNIFEINNQTDFNPSKKAACVVTIDTQTVLEGIFQLTNIYINDSSEIEYQCILFGEIKDVYKTIGEKYITGNENTSDNIDVSEYNHTLSYTNIKASWSGNADTKGYLYPIIDFGAGFTSETLNGSEKLLPFDNFYPALYVKPLFKKILNKAGFTYTSSFLDNNETFKKLFLPVTAAGNFDNRVIATRSTALSITKAIKSFDFDSENYDLGGEFQPLSGGSGSTAYSTHGFIPNANGLYIVKLTLSGNISNGEVFFDLYVADNNSYKATGTNVDKCLGSTKTLGDASNPTVFIKVVNLAAGGKYNVTCTSTSTGVTGNIDAGAKLEIMSYTTVVNMNNSLPPKFKQADLITAVTKLFNLYVEPDKSNSKNLLIEPRDAYYASGVVKDWSVKLDKGNGYDLSILSELTAKKFRFTYTEDSDKLNTDYKTIRNEIYGEHELEIDNDFTTNEIIIQSIFAPTPVEYVQGFSKVALPKIYKQGTNGKIQSTDYKPRILINFGEYTIPNSGTIKVNVNGTESTATTYCYTGMYELPEITGATTANAKSILFGNVKPINGSDNGNLSHNLFNDYYSDEISAISSPDAKMLTAYFYLTAADVAQFSFNDKIYLEIENSPSYWRVNRIVDFDAVAPKLTKVELIKLDEIYLTPTKTKVRGKYDIDPKGSGYDTNVKNEPTNNVVRGKNNDVYSGETVVVGTGNIVGSGTEGTVVTGKGNVVGTGNKQNHVKGDSNFIDGNSTTVTVHGNSNTVGSGATNVAVRGNSNVIPDSAVNITVHGNSNTVNAGITGVSIFGNSKVAAVSNTAYYDSIAAAGTGHFTGKVTIGGSPVAVTNSMFHVIAPDITALSTQWSTRVEGTSGTYINTAVTSNATYLFSGSALHLNNRNDVNTYISPNTANGRVSIGNPFGSLQSKFLIVGGNSSAGGAITQGDYLRIEDSFDGTAQLKFTSGKQLQIGTTTSAKLSIKSLGATNASLALNVENSDGTRLLKVSDTGNMYLGNGTFVTDSNSGYVLNVKTNSTSGGIRVETNTGVIGGYDFYAGTVDGTRYWRMNAGAGTLETHVHGGNSSITAKGSLNGITISADSGAIVLQPSATLSTKTVLVGTTTQSGTGRLEVRGTVINSGVSPYIARLSADVSGTIQAVDFGVNSSGTVTMDATNSNQIRINSSNNGTVQIGGSGTLNRVHIGTLNATTAKFTIAGLSEQNSYFKIVDDATATNTYLDFTSAGNLGIGASTIGSKLTVKSSGNIADFQNGSASSVLQVTDTSVRTSVKTVIGGTLEVSGTSSVFLPPKLSTTNRNNLSASALVAGAIIYNTDTNTVENYTGSGWVTLGESCCFKQQLITLTEIDTTQYTITQDFVDGSGQLFKNGLLLIDGIDYTISSGVITFVIPIQPSDRLVFFGAM